MDKIYITGPVGGGKSTLARRIEKICGIPHCELDSLVHIPDPRLPDGNRKRDVSEREALFGAFIGQSRWVVEDAGRAYFEEALDRADCVVLLEPPTPTRMRRILIRWLKQNLRLEKCGYRPSLHMLRCMFRWTKRYDSGEDGLKERLTPFVNKLRILRTNADIKRFVGSIKKTEAEEQTL